MPFKFAVERENYADYASGKVFYNLPGHPAFPVRLASEIFQPDALRKGAIQEHFAGKQADIVITDIPYGVQSQWALPEATQGKETAWFLLENLKDVLAANSIVAVASTKQHKIAHEDYRQV